jgi:hypothetical protein
MLTQHRVEPLAQRDQLSGRSSRRSLLPRAHRLGRRTRPRRCKAGGTVPNARTTAAASEARSASTCCRTRFDLPREIVVRCHDLHVSCGDRPGNASPERLLLENHEVICGEVRASIRRITVQMHRECMRWVWPEVTRHVEVRREHRIADRLTVIKPLEECRKPARGNSGVEGPRRCDDRANSPFEK